MGNKRCRRGATLGEKLDYYSLATKNGCIEWVGYKNRHGYGQVSANEKTLYAHRVAFEIAFGEITSNLHVLHTCDNPSCVNTEHLFLGTHLDNMRDKVSKNRQTYGESHPCSKLSRNEVIEIKRLLKMKTTQDQIALMFNVTRWAISNINTGRTWPHISQ